MGLRSWSWQVVLPGVSLVVLLVATHFFVTPLVPTFFVDPSVLVFQRINDTHGWNVEWALVCGKDHGAFVYRNATWKAKVGCWLSQCGNSAVPVPVVEVSVGTEISLKLTFLSQLIFFLFGIRGLFAALTRKFLQIEHVLS